MIKKGFSIPDVISQDLSSTVDFVKNNIGSMNYRLVPLTAIELDPDNPRKLSISKEDVTNGLKAEDSTFEIKTKELTSLQEMAETIKAYGVRNPVEIYKYGSGYRLIHGERRCLASILAAKTNIPAKILDEKPNNLDIRLLQLIENVQREDLSLSDFLNNIRSIIIEYKNSTKEDFELNASFLEKLINKSRAQCFNIMSVLNAPEEVQSLIKTGKLKNLEKAAIIATVKETTKRQELLQACVNGESLKKLKEMKGNSSNLNINERIEIIHRRKPGRRASKINLGATIHTEVVSKLVNLVLQDPKYSAYEATLKRLNCKNYESCTSSFESLIKIMEKVEVIKAK